MQVPIAGIFTKQIKVVQVLMQEKRLFHKADDIGVVLEMCGFSILSDLIINHYRDSYKMAMY